MALDRILVGGALVALLGSHAPAQRAPAWPASESDEIRAIVSEMLADAETRSSLRSARGGAGYDGGFYIASADDDFRLNVKALLEFRYHLNFHDLDDDDDGDGSEFDSGFSVPRTLLFFKGHVIDPRIFYQIRLNFRRAGGEAVLDDAFVGYRFNDEWSMRWGQGLMAFSREWYRGDIMLQTIERSLVALVFGEQRAQLIDLTYQGDDLEAILTFSDGFRSQNTEFTDDPAAWAVTLRGEWKIAGGWADVLGAYTSPRGSGFAALVGAAVHFEQGENADDAPEQDLLAWTADAMVKGDGWNVFLTATGYHTRDEAGVEGADFDEYGAVAQGGVYLTDDLELYGRWTGLFPDDDRTEDDVLHTLTAGLNYYLHGLAARVSLQAEWFLDGTNDIVIGNFGGAGGRRPTSTLFNSLPSDDQQVAVTAQFALLF